MSRQLPLLCRLMTKKKERDLVLVPHSEVFSNRFLEDLEKIWELRYYIPDPNKLNMPIVLAPYHHATRAKTYKVGNGIK